MLNAAFLKDVFSTALPYDAYVATGNASQRENWKHIHESAQLAPDQERLISGFARNMNVLVSSGVWCGDCVQQCPLLARIAEAADDRIDLRFVDRDQHPELARHIQINAGLRVPVVLFMAEDFELVSVVGDRTLSRYRALAAKQLGASCPLPGAPIPTEEIAATLQDWLDEFERVHLLLRLSTRLRQLHGD